MQLDDRAKRVLWAVAAFPICGSSQVAEQLGVSPAMVTPTLGRLRRLGLIEDRGAVIRTDKGWREQSWTLTDEGFAQYIAQARIWLAKQQVAA